ncbi:hypothetical protein B0J17DRAFT_713542 [Rhizoctonia solani]|nr:hypothetical protein B0J17DRAFT_713542 [Rhizoctonia solani]
MKRGRSLGVQSLDGYTGRPSAVEPLWTEEPSPIIAKHVGGGGVRGRQTAIEASAPSSSVHNVTQALSLSQLAPVFLAAESLEPESYLQAGAEAVIEGKGDGAGHGIPHKGRIYEYGYLLSPQETPIFAAVPTITPIINKNLHTHRIHNCSLQRVGTDPAPLSQRLRTNNPTQPRLLRTSSTHGPNEAVSHRVSASSLLASLFTGSRAHKPPTLFMLAIAVAYNNLKDPQHDFELIQTWLKDHESGSVHFQGISGEEATRERIEDAIGELYRKALRSSGSSLLILLTGEGDYTNKMHLVGGRFITDSDLRIWLWKLRNESKPLGVPTTIILDYCRTNKHIPLGAAQEGVKFIWSCSLGQTAAALSLPNTKGLPRSCFLLALMMSSYNYTYIKTDLRAAIDYELDQLSSFLAFTHEKVHKEELCGPCRTKTTCGRPIPPPQNPDWQQVGCMKSIHDLAYVLSTTKINVVSKVYRVLMSNRWFREANKLPINWVIKAKGDLTNSGSMVRYKRGTCQPVYTGIPIRAFRRDCEAME